MWLVWHDVTKAADTLPDTLTADQQGTYLEQNTQAMDTHVNLMLDHDNPDLATSASIEVRKKQGF
jgi:hypothetical protein